MKHPLGMHLCGDAERALEAFYGSLPRISREEWPAMIHGMGYNFEFYDALFPIMVGHVQMSLDEGDYTQRQAAMQAALLPFCSEYGIEPGRPLFSTHRRLFSEFYRAAVGREMPERYPSAAENRWLAASKAWAGRMVETVSCPAVTLLERARFNIGYYWAVEYLSIIEFSAMRRSWERLGLRADYLDVHCAVEDEHTDCATRAVLAFTRADDPLVIQAAQAHERDLAGYYTELSGFVANPRD